MRRTIGFANDPVAARARREVEYGAEADGLARERTITVSGLTENAGGVGITVLVNGTVAPQGKPWLTKSKWSWCALKIPGKAPKQRSNTIAIQNDSGDGLHINYLFLQHLAA
jgi:hypothetical protein